MVKRIFGAFGTRLHNHYSHDASCLTACCRSTTSPLGPVTSGVGSGYWHQTPGTYHSSVSDTHEDMTASRLPLTSASVWSKRAVHCPLGPATVRQLSPCVKQEWRQGPGTLLMYEALSQRKPPPNPRALLEREGCDRGKFQSGCRAVTGDVKQLGGGYWRLEMRLGLVLGYGNACGVESGPECWGGEPPPPPPSSNSLPNPPCPSASNLPPPKKNPLTPSPLAQLASPPARCSPPLSVSARGRSREGDTRQRAAFLSR